MEKKSIGSFIATMRKANGMTQKELAERLCVSDKTISRWECDDGYPDIAAIPVMAEIFGVTCDEILRGERSQSVSASENERLSRKGEKERKRVLSSAFFFFRIQNMVILVPAFLSLAAALICNLVFLKATLGFIAASVFSFIAYILIALFHGFFIQQISDEAEDDGESDISAMRTKALFISERTAVVTTLLFSFSIPLLFVRDRGAGLAASSALHYGALSAAATLSVALVAVWLINGILLLRKKLIFPEREKARFRWNHRLKAILFIVLFIILVIMSDVFENTDRKTYAENRIVFDNLESFMEFVERSEEMKVVEGSPLPVRVIRDGGQDEEKTAYLRDNEGNIILTYAARNRNVSTIHYSVKDGQLVMPITVATYEGASEANMRVRAGKPLQFLSYAAAGVIITGLYFVLKKRK